MKISKVEIIPFDQPYKGEMVYATGGVPAVGTFLLVRITTDEGVAGIGSGNGYTAPPRLGMGNSRESAMVLMKHLASALIGEDPLNTERLLDKLESMTAGAYAEDWWTLHHFDSALYDLKGKILGVPVYELIGGLYRDRIPLEHIQSFLPTPEAQAVQAKEFIDAGYHSIKLHVGADPKLAVARFKAVREAVGPDIKIGTDMGAAYNVPDALRVIEESNEYDLHYAEQPLSTYDYDGFISLRNRTKVPLVADQSGLSVNEAYRMIKLGAFDSFHCLLPRVGGIRRAIKYANLMEVANLDYQICTVGNSITQAAGVHFAFSRRKKEKLLDELGIFLYLHGTKDTNSITGDIVKQISGKIENGYLYPPSGPGLGVELDEEALAEFAAPDLKKIVVEA